MNILLIDDTPEDREQICRAVQNCAANISVHCAESARKAMERLSDYPSEVFDVMLIDRHLPDMLGTDLANLIRSEGLAKNAALIMVTGDIGDIARADALAHNFDGFISKPANSNRLKAMLIEKKIFWEISDLPHDLHLYKSRLEGAG